MEWTVSGEDIFVRLDPGEEIHASLALADEIGLNGTRRLPVELAELARIFTAS